MSDDEFWRTVVPEARRALLEVLAARYAAEAPYRRPLHGFLGSLLIVWVSTDGSRRLSLDLLEPDEPLAIDHFFKTLSIDDQPRELALRLREPPKQLALVIQCFEQWLIEGQDEHELDEALNRAVQESERP